MDISWNATLNGNSNINAAIKADGDISILGEVSNSNNAVLYSEFGDVIINTDNVNFSGLIYAPNGDIKIDAEYVNLNSVVIIGQTINIDCPNNVNANMNYSLARYISDASRSTEEEEPTIEEPEDDTLYAWAKYKKKTNSIIINWQEDDSSVYNVYLKGDEPQLLGEVSDVTEFTFEIDPENALDEYVFAAEKTDIYGNTIVSNDVIVRRNEKGTYKFIDTDSNEDGLEDLTEVNLGTDRFDPDSDEDDLPDGYEYFEIQTDPTEYDTDENGIGDGDEDFEGDGLTNVQEYSNGTNPYNGDTDEDGFPDGYEVSNGMDPLDYDQIVIDEDFITQIEEFEENDIDVLNMDEHYPLIIEHNEYGNIKSINGVFSEINVKSAQDAIYSLYSIKTLLGLECPSTELRFVDSFHSDVIDTYSFIQIYDEIEISGHGISVTTNKDGKVISLYSSYIDKYDLNKLNKTSIISENDLLNNTGIIEDTTVLSTELIVYTETTPILAYIIHTSKNESLLVDATNGEILKKSSNTKNDRVLAHGKDEHNMPISFFVDEEDETFYLRDTLRGIYVFNNYYNNRFEDYRTDDYSMQTNCNDYFYEKIPFYSDYEYDWDDRSATTTYANMIKVYDWYNTHLRYKGLDGVGGNTCGIQVPIIMHVFEDSDIGINAAYNYSIENDSDSIQLLDNRTQTITEASNIDTLGHEYGHAVFYHTNKKINNATESTILKTINEAYADIFGSCVKNEWRDSSSCDRTIADPINSKKRNYYPEKYEGINFDISSNDEHKNSTVISHAAYLLENDYGFSFERIAYLFYHSIPEFDDTCNYQQVRNNVLKAAMQCHFSDESIQDIRKAFDRVNLTGQKGSALIKVYDGNTPIENASVFLYFLGAKEATRYTNSS